MWRALTHSALTHDFPSLSTRASSLATPCVGESSCTLPETVLFNIHSNSECYSVSKGGDRAGWERERSAEMRGGERRGRERSGEEGKRASSSL